MAFNVCRPAPHLHRALMAWIGRYDILKVQESLSFACCMKPNKCRQRKHVFLVLLIEGDCVGCGVRTSQKIQKTSIRQKSLLFSIGGWDSVQHLAESDTLLVITNEKYAYLNSNWLGRQIRLPWTDPSRLKGSLSIPESWWGSPHKHSADQKRAGRLRLLL